MNVSGNFGFCPTPYLYHLNADGQVIGRTDTRTNEYEEGSDFPKEHIDENMKYVSAEEFRKMIEKAKEETERLREEIGFDPDKVTTVDFYKLNWIGGNILTGNPEEDAAFAVGLRFREKCFTFDGTDEEFNRTFVDLMLKKDEPDYTGMSPEEIYKAEYKKFQDIWGEDFLDADAVNHFNWFSGKDKYLSVIDLFSGRVSGLCGKNASDMRREALYPDMTDGEVQKTIIENYRKKCGGDLTGADLCKIAGEMRRVGVDHGLYSFMNSHGIESDVSFKPGMESTVLPAKENWLNKRVTKATLDRLGGIYSGLKMYCTAPMDERLGYMVNLLCSEALPKVTIHR